MTHYRNVDITGKTPALGVGVPRNYPRKEIFACLTRTDSIRGSDSPCEPYCAPKTLDFDYVPDGAHNPTDNVDGTHHTIRHQHHQVYFLRRSLPGSLIRTHMRRRAIGSSVGMSSNSGTSQQQ